MMGIKALAIGVLAVPVLSGPLQAGAPASADATSAHAAIAKPKCTPPKIAVWGRVSTRGREGWRCALPPAPNCGRHARPIWHSATSTWTCEACRPGEIASSTPASGGARFGHCRRPPLAHRVTIHLSTHVH